MQARRRSVEALARSVLSPTDVPDNELKKWWSLFGVESISPKLADAICTLYNTPPYREFSLDGGTNDAFTELYDSFGVDHAIKDAYRSSLFTNVVALLPDWDTKTIKVLTPDYFRLVGSDELWIATGNGGWNETEFHVWSADTVKTVAHDGKLIKQEANPYGRIPAVILKLNRSNDIYGSGITEAAELSAWSNFIRFISTRIGVFQSFSVGFAKNLEIKTGTRIGPGFILAGENRGGEVGQNPSFEYVSPQGQFLALEEYRQSVIRSFERNQGLPGFLVDEGAGQPPTGAALQVMERGLNEKRKEHSHALIKAEKDLVSLIALQAKLFGKRDITADAFNVQYADSETFGDPKVELDYDMYLTLSGLMAPSALVQKYMGLKLADEEADALIDKNKKFFAASNELRSTVGGATALQSLVVAYEAKQISRGAAMVLAVNLYDYPITVADQLFAPELLPTKPIV
jgi:hypothetical protein